MSGNALDNSAIGQTHNLPWYLTYTLLPSKKQIPMTISKLVNTFNAEAIHSSKEKGRKYFLNPSKPCHVGIHWIALAEYSQMSTHLPGAKSFLRVFASFCIGQISHHQRCYKGLKKDSQQNKNTQK